MQNNLSTYYPFMKKIIAELVLACAQIDNTLGHGAQRDNCNHFCISKTYRLNVTGTVEQLTHVWVVYVISVCSIVSKACLEDALLLSNTVTTIGQVHAGLRRLCTSHSCQRTLRSCAGLD